METAKKRAIAHQMRQDGKTYVEIGKVLGCVAERARQLCKANIDQPVLRPRGPKPTPSDTHRRSITVRLPPAVVAALETASAENGTTMTDEIEARLIETLMADGLLSRGAATSSCGAYASASAALF